MVESPDQIPHTVKLPIQLTDPEIRKKRLLCEVIGKPGYFEAVVLEVSPSNKFLRLMRADGMGTEWGTFPLVRVLEVLADDSRFGDPSPCS